MVQIKAYHLSSYLYACARSIRLDANTDRQMNGWSDNPITERRSFQSWIQRTNNSAYILADNDTRAKQSHAACEYH